MSQYVNVIGRQAIGLSRLRLEEVACALSLYVYVCILGLSID